MNFTNYVPTEPTISDADYMSFDTSWTDNTAYDSTGLEAHEDDGKGKGIAS